MIIVPLTGGIGNQMFQYACGRAVAQKRGDDLVLFTGYLSSPASGSIYGLYAFSQWKYGLYAFNIQAQVHSTWEFAKGLDLLWWVHQIDSRFNPALFQSACSNLVLRGYWESENYFMEIRETIRRDFEFREDFPVWAEDAGVTAQMSMRESICLHVRRTDVDSKMDPKGFVGIGYYEAALNIVAERLKEPFIYVFSDDIEWCVANLPLKYPHSFVSPQQDPKNAAMRDLRLMTQCKHFIVANSTFSWWAAWLGSCPNKVVIAPRRWFRSEGLWSGQLLHVFRSDDLLPESWIRA